MNILVENQINNFISGKKIKDRKILSQAFNMKCEKIILEDDEAFVIKYYQKKNKNFNSLVSETQSLQYLLSTPISLFPSIKYKSDTLLITDYIENNNIKKIDYQEQLATEILKLHAIKNDKYGFIFDAQIGGFQQINEYEGSWIKFFGEQNENFFIGCTTN